jgi:hypothetical protein
MKSKMRVYSFVLALISQHGYVLGGNLEFPPQIEISNSEPMLEIKLDCGSCELKQGILDKITESYTQAAIKGRSIKSRFAAKLTIREIDERSTAWKLVAGPLFFIRSDRIYGTISRGEQIVNVEYSVTNPIKNIDDVAMEYGKVCYERLHAEVPGK